MNMYKTCDSLLNLASKPDEIASLSDSDLAKELSRNLIHVAPDLSPLHVHDNLDIYWARVDLNIEPSMLVLV